MLKADVCVVTEIDCEDVTVSVISDWVEPYWELRDEVVTVELSDPVVKVSCV